MNHDNASGYGMWPLVIINSLVFIIFAFSFTKPRNARDWRTFGTFAAFIVALFTEMYGFPLTVYLLSGWLGSRYPVLNLYSHNNGHLWHTLFGLRGDPHFDVFHILSSAFIFGGFWLLASAWNVLYRAQSTRPLLFDSTSAIRSVRADYVRIFVAMANASHPRYVSDFDLGLHAAGAS